MGSNSLGQMSQRLMIVLSSCNVDLDVLTGAFQWVHDYMRWVDRHYAWDANMWRSPTSIACGVSRSPKWFGLRFSIFFKKIVHPSPSRWHGEQLFRQKSLRLAITLSSCNVNIDVVPQILVLWIQHFGADGFEGGDHAFFMEHRQWCGPIDSSVMDPLDLFFMSILTQDMLPTSSTGLAWKVIFGVLEVALVPRLIYWLLFGLTLSPSSGVSG